MPKRIIRSKRDFNRGFIHGFSMGKNQTLLSLQLINLREKKGMTVEEFAKGADVPEEFIRGIEAIDFHTFLKTDIEFLTKIAKFCDVAVDISFTSGNDNSFTVKDIEVKTHQEEFEVIEPIIELETVISIATSVGAWIPQSLPSDWDNGDIVFSPAQLLEFFKAISK